jgi:hypothetical protein
MKRPDLAIRSKKQVVVPVSVYDVKARQIGGGKEHSLCERPEAAPQRNFGPERPNAIVTANRSKALAKYRDLVATLLQGICETIDLKGDTRILATWKQRVCHRDFHVFFASKILA